MSIQDKEREREEWKKIGWKQRKKRMDDEGIKKTGLKNREKSGRSER